MNVALLVIVFSCCALCSTSGGSTNTPMSEARIGATLVTLNRVQMTNIRLVSTQEDLLRNLDAGKLQAFDWEIADAIDKGVGSTNDSFKLVVRVRLTKDKRPSFDTASKGSVPKKTLRRISRSLRGVSDYRSRQDDFHYEMEFTIHHRP